MGIFGAITWCALIFVNLVNLPWFVWLLIEQVQTGWGYGSDMEIMVLLPLAVEFLCIPVFFVALIYVVLCYIPKIKQNYLNSGQPDNYKVFKINVGLLIGFVLQIGVTNVFIWN